MTVTDRPAAVLSVAADLLARSPALVFHYIDAAATAECHGLARISVVN